MSEWHDRNHIDAQPKGRAREEFLQLAVSTQEWHPDFNVGDHVRRRGPLFHSDTLKVADE